MQKTRAIDKSGEDPTECEYCGFRNGGHMADCPLAHPIDAPVDAPNKRMTHEDTRRNALTLAFLKATERRFSGEPLTGFGSL